MIMKKLKTSRIFFCILLAGIILQAGSRQVNAKNSYDPTRKGNITVTLDDLRTDRNGVDIACYRVGSPILKDGLLVGFFPEKNLESLNLDFTNLEDSAKHRETAEKLEGFLKEHKDVQPIQRGKTNQAGSCSFSGLEQGMYLLMQEGGFSTYGTIQTFLVGIPYMEDDILLYDVKTETKGEKPDTKPEEPPKEPEEEKPDTDKPAKTGDSSPVGLLLGMFGISAAVLLFLAGKMRKQK